MSATARRTVIGLLLGLSGCGFRPVYLARGASGQDVTEDLAAITVPVLPERSGQVLRQALQARLDGGGIDVPKRFQLNVRYAISLDVEGIQEDSSVTRLRLIGRGDWTLSQAPPGTTVLVSGTSRSIDGYDNIDNQFFQSDLDNEVVTRRVAEALADQITLQLAAYFHRQAGRA